MAVPVPGGLPAPDPALRGSGGALPGLSAGALAVDGTAGAPAAARPARGAWGLTLEVYRDVGGDWRWRARGRNGRIVADSAEGYTRRARALGGFVALARGVLAGVRLRVVGRGLDNR